MKTLLAWIIVVEGTLLLAGASALLLGVESPRAEVALAPVFRPPIKDAVIGEFVRYRRVALDAEGRDGEILGFVEYKVLSALEVRGTTFGREFVIAIIERDKKGSRVLRQRQLRMRPQDLSHGFLPPRMDEDDRPVGARPIVKTIRTAQIPYYASTAPGFLVETVYPREASGEVRERYYFTDRIPVFGVSRWERGRDALVVHHVDRAKKP